MKINYETEEAIPVNRTEKFKLLLSNKNITHITAQIYIIKSIVTEGISNGKPYKTVCKSSLPHTHTYEIPVPVINFYDDVYLL